MSTSEAVSGFVPTAHGSKAHGNSAPVTAFSTASGSSGSTVFPELQVNYPQPEFSLSFKEPRQEIDLEDDEKVREQLVKLMAEYKLPEQKQHEIKAKMLKAIRSANQKYHEDLQAPEKAKADAKMKWDSAVRKYDLDADVLKLKTTNGLEDLGVDFDQCQEEASEGKHSEWKKRICGATYHQNRAEKVFEFQKEMQKHLQGLASAYSDWIKAQVDYNAALCLVEAGKQKILKTALHDLYAELNQEAEKIQ